MTGGASVYAFPRIASLLLSRSELYWPTKKRIAKLIVKMSVKPITNLKNVLSKGLTMLHIL